MNNEAEYEAIISGLKLAIGLGVKKMIILCDSQLIVNHIHGNYSAKEPRMSAYLKVVRDLMIKIPSCTIEQIPRGENSHSTALASLGSIVRYSFKRTITIDYIKNPSLDSVEEKVYQSTESPSWNDVIFQYIQSGILPEDKKVAKNIRQKAARYAKIGGNLYK